MSAAWSFLAGWCSASLFILVGSWLSARRRPPAEYADTADFLASYQPQGEDHARRA